MVEVIKRFVIFLSIFMTFQIFAESQMIADFSDIQSLTTKNMLQTDGSIWFDGKKDYLKMNNPAYNQEAMAIYMKFRLTSSNFMNRTIELVNTADVGVEEGSSGNWGVSVNYGNEGLEIFTKDYKYNKMIYNLTKFKFIKDEIYELYVYLDSKNIRIYVDGKCIAQKRLPYGYYNAKNLYIGAGVLANSYSGMQLYDCKLFTGKQTKEESEKLSLEGNAVLKEKIVLGINDLQYFNRGKLKLKQDVKIESGKCLTLINPMKKSNSFGAYFDFTFNAKTQLLKNTLEFFNTADSMVEIMGKWGLSLNYDKSGLSIYTRNSVGKTQAIKTGVFFRENERYSMFVYIDTNDIYIYVNGKCVKRAVNTNLFYKEATYLHIGAGVLVNSYVPMTLHDFKLTNKLLENKKEVDEMLVSLMTDEDEKLNTIVMKEDKKDDFSFQVKNKENYILAGAIASYAVSAIAFTFIPVTFGIYGYNDFLYKENASKYRKAIYQDELDLYYKEMECSSRNANAALVSGITLIPVCVATLTSGIILTVIYQKLKMEHLPKVAFGFVPNQGCAIQFSVPLKG